MSQNLGEAALRLCGMACRLLGWRPHEFWVATPAELACALAVPADHTEPLDRSGLEALMEHENG